MKLVKPLVAEVQHTIRETNTKMTVKVEMINDHCFVLKVGSDYYSHVTKFESSYPKASLILRNQIDKMNITRYSSINPCAVTEVDIPCTHLSTLLTAVFGRKCGDVVQKFEEHFKFNQVNKRKVAKR